MYNHSQTQGFQIGSGQLQASGFPANERSTAIDMDYQQMKNIHMYSSKGLDINFWKLLRQLLWWLFCI